MPTCGELSVLNERLGDNALLEEIIRRSSPTDEGPLFGVRPLDPLSFGMVFSSWSRLPLASYLPASLVSAINPVDVLKAE